MTEKGKKLKVQFPFRRDENVLELDKSDRTTL